MDWLDWLVRGGGAAFGALTILFGLSRATGFAERDISPLWWAGFAVIGAVWGVALVADWVLPIDTTIYLANGGQVARAVQLGDREVCIPAKSYDGFTWRLGAPAEVTMLARGDEPMRHYAVGKGTWFINLSQTLVTADLYDQGGTVSFDAIFANRSEALKISGRYGQPFRLFTQMPLDRAYSTDGDVARASIDGPCPKALAEPAPK